MLHSFRYFVRGLRAMLCTLKILFVVVLVLLGSGDVPYPYKLFTRCARVTRSFVSHGRPRLLFEGTPIHHEFVGLVWGVIPLFFELFLLVCPVWLVLFCMLYLRLF